MNGADPDRWSAVAADWSVLWGDLAAPVWHAVAAGGLIAPGRRVLDAGCGSGEFLAYALTLGASVAGTDPAPGMLGLARERAPAAVLRAGSVDAVPWPDDSFDVVTAFNALQFADDHRAALGELARVTAAGGVVAVASWAERARNDLDAVEDAVTRADGEEPRADADYRLADGLERTLASAGLELVRAGIVKVPWTVPDDATLVRGVLLGEDVEVAADTAPVVLEAARPFRRRDGSYRLVNHFRYAVASVPARDR